MRWRGLTLSSLMPGIMPAFVIRSTILLPSASLWKRVSQCRMTPEMYFESPGVLYWERSSERGQHRGERDAEGRRLGGVAREHNVPLPAWSGRQRGSRVYQGSSSHRRDQPGATARQTHRRRGNPCRATTCPARSPPETSSARQSAMRSPFNDAWTEYDDDEMNFFRHAPGMQALQCGEHQQRFPKGC